MLVIRAANTAVYRSICTLRILNKLSSRRTTDLAASNRGTPTASLLILDQLISYVLFGFFVAVPAVTVTAP